MAVKKLYVVIFIGPKYVNAYGPYGRGKAQYLQRFFKRRYPGVPVIVRRLIG